MQTKRPQVIPPEAIAHAGDPERCVGDLILVEPQGRGGTGTVWRAWDRALGRWVAVKVATAALESGIARDRFSREAQATARLSHPNIVPVFQVGMDKGRAFLVMPLVEGQTLAGKTPPLTQALRIMRDAALAVHHAHAQGIVHRDLKPGNLMLDQEGRVMVLDFGLAYLLEASARLTQQGEVLGTASFMAPEQARGDTSAPGLEIDVYGLGATLFALVTGQAPFVGDSLAAVIAQVTTNEPPSPRQLRPNLDPRVDAIVMKAMARDPSHRYASAADFAADLDRVMRGEGVGVGHAGPMVRAFRRLRRLPWVAAVAGLVAIGVPLGVAQYRDTRTKREAMAALRDVGNLALETALQLRRAGDTSGMRKVLPQLIEAYRRLGEDTPVFAEAEYLMGRTYRALMNEDDALRHQNRALQLDPGYGPALYERAVLLSQQYGRLREQVIMGLQTEGWSSQTADEDVETLRPYLGELRARILEDCDRLRAAAPSRTMIDAALGILAYHRSDFDQARLRLQQAVELDSLREEAWMTLALTEAASGYPHRAQAIYTQALRHDRGYAPYHVGLCEVLRRQRPAEAMSAADAALLMDPSSVAARVCGAGAGVELGHHQIRLGHDPSKLLDRAESMLNEAMKLAQPPAALISRGILNRYRGWLKVRRDLDPSAAYAQSLADFDQVLRQDESLAEAWFGRGRTLWYRSLHTLELTEDLSGLRTDLQIAKANYNEAERLAPALATSRLWRAELLGLEGHLAAVASRTDVALASFDAAESDFVEAMARKDDGWGRLVRGNVRLWRGLALANAGKDPDQAWRDARADLDQAVAWLDPGFADPLVRRGLLSLHSADFEARRSKDADRSSWLKRAVSDFDAALVLDPEHVDALIGRAHARELLGQRGGAHADRQRALNLQPRRAAKILQDAPPLPL